MIPAHWKPEEIHLDDERILILEFTRPLGSSTTIQLLPKRIFAQQASEITAAWDDAAQTAEGRDGPSRWK